MRKELRVELCLHRIEHFFELLSGQLSRTLDMDQLGRSGIEILPRVVVGSQQLHMICADTARYPVTKRGVRALIEKLLQSLGGDARRRSQIIDANPHPRFDLRKL